MLPSLSPSLHPSSILRPSIIYPSVHPSSIPPSIPPSFLLPSTHPSLSLAMIFLLIPWRVRGESVHHVLSHTHTQRVCDQACGTSVHADEVVEREAPPPASGPDVGLEVTDGNDPSTGLGLGGERKTTPSLHPLALSFLSLSLSLSQGGWMSVIPLSRGSD